MISAKAKYGLKALVALAKHYNSQKPVLISDLASAEHMPKKFLELILLDLKNGGILISKRGKNGGYLLSRKPELISAGDVIRVLEGTLSPLSCLSQKAYKKCEECRDEESCVVRSLMKDVREATVKILDNTTLKDILEKAATPEALSFAI